MTQLASDSLVTVFGGSGFIGRHVVRALAKRGYRVRVAVRRPDLALFLQPLGRVGQIYAEQANLRYPGSVAAALRDATAAVNLVGIGFERGEHGVALVDEALVHLECDVHARHEAGDHTIVVCAVERAAAHDGRPLLYYRGGYAQLER